MVRCIHRPTKTNTPLLSPIETPRDWPFSLSYKVSQKTSCFPPLLEDGIPVVKSCDVVKILYIREVIHHTRISYFSRKFQLEHLEHNRGVEEWRGDPRELGAAVVCVAA